MLQFVIPSILQALSLSRVGDCLNNGMSCFESRRHFLASSAATFMIASSSSSSSSLPAMTTTSGESESQPPSIRWGIVGLGDVTNNKSGPPFFKCNGSSLVAVMRRTPGKATEWVQRVVPPGNQCVGYDNLDDFLRHDGLDAVYISTPPASHVEICRKVAAAGKAVYVEKPVGRCGAETRAMVDCMREVGKPLYTAYISRAYNRTQTLRQLLSEGRIGDRVLRVDYRFIGNIVPRGFDRESPPWRVVAEKAGGGEIMDVGCHIIDRIDYVFGPLIDVEGSAENKNSVDQRVEDYVQLRASIGPSTWAATSSEGAAVSCTWDFSGRSNGTVDELIVTGPKGYMKMVGMSPSLPISLYDQSNVLVKQIDFAPPEHTGQPLIQAVTDDLRGVAKAPFLSFGDNAVRTAGVLDKVLNSYYGGREIGFWFRPESWPGYQSALKSYS